MGEESPGRSWRGALTREAAAGRRADGRSCFRPAHPLTIFFPNPVTACHKRKPSPSPLVPFAPSFAP
jgi:hypothetical protein